MKSFTTNNRARSNLFALTVITLGAVLLFTPRTGNTQQLQRGISVQMAQTSTATPMPEADNQDAWIVSVTADGTLYFGLDPVTPSELSDKMKSRPRNRDQRLYIKADARAQFADVRRVLTAAQEVYFNPAVFLASQASTASGAVVPPMGLEVQVGPHSNTATIVVQINAGQPSPMLELNDQPVAVTALPDSLRRLLENQGDTPVLVKTSGPVTFAPVLQVIDICHSVGAKVMLSTPQL